MSKTIILNRKLTDSEKSELEQLVQSGYEVYAFPGTDAPDFAHSIAASTDEKRAINYQMMDEVLRFGDFPVGERTIAERFSIDTASVWHYHKFRVYFAVRNLMYFLQPILNKFDSFDDHIWFVGSDTRALRKIFPQVKYRLPQEQAKEAFNYRILWSYLVLSTYRVGFYCFSFRKRPEYLLYLTERYSNVLDKKTLKIKQGHHILEYLIGELDDRFALLTEVLMPKPKGKSDYSYSKKQFDRSWGNCGKIFIEGFMVSGLLSKKVRRSVKEAQQSLKLGYVQARETELTLNQQLILELFQSLHSSSRFFLFRYFAARKYFANSGLKAIVAADENSPLTKSVLDAARFCGIKVIGLQHGTMHDLHPAYLYTPNDSANKVMPDLTLTWGAYWEDFLLEKGNYPTGSVVSVGQIRTDIIPVLTKAESRKQINPAQQIVFASQPQRDPELRFQAAYDVFYAAKSLPNTHLIVKLHPREFGDTAYYADIAAKAGCKNYTIDKTSDLYQLIASCDVLITCFSTVGTETVYFHKPLVILDHLSQDIMGYAAEGVAFQATNAESLTRILSGIFKGTLRVDRVKYNTFIQKYAYRIDGKVAERCINAIVDQTGN
jgi:hypothetical protein